MQFFCFPLDMRMNLHEEALEVFSRKYTPSTPLRVPRGSNLSFR